jgi:hypothetical protein
MLSGRPNHGAGARTSILWKLVTDHGNHFLTAPIDSLQFAHSFCPIVGKACELLDEAAFGEVKGHTDLGFDI